MEYGLIGAKLGYSFSKILHEKFNLYPYDLCPLKESSLEDFFQKGNFKGINVTIPYKQKVAKYCDQVDSIAKDISAINTIYREDGLLKGTNTDLFGFEYMIEKAGISLHKKNVLVLGTGGAASMVKVAAQRAKSKSLYLASRTGPTNYSNLPKDSQIIINATPIGTYPDNESRPTDLSFFKDLQGVVDLVYNPLKSSFVLQGEDLNIPSTGGLLMLVAQAAKAASLFAKSKTPLATISEVYSQLLLEQKNIVLIGMPGVGKTTIGKILGKKMKRRVVDIDMEIQRETGLSPAEIITSQGETTFRQIETKVVKKVAKNQSLIISTGGGSILREENRIALRQNGEIIHIKRDISNLSQKNRPLSRDMDTLLQLEEKRMPIYETLSHYQLVNKDSLEEACTQILSYFTSHSSL